jgi:hypothetical protein
MRCKRLRRYIERLKALQGQRLSRDRLLMKLGAARQEAGRAARLVEVTLPKVGAGTASFQFRLDREKLRQVRAREGRYLLRTNLGAQDPAPFYIQLTEVEQAFKELKHDLAVRPIFHHDETRIEAHSYQRIAQRHSPCSGDLRVFTPNNSNTWIVHQWPVEKVGLMDNLGSTQRTQRKPGGHGGKSGGGGAPVGCVRFTLDFPLCPPWLCALCVESGSKCVIQVNPDSASRF